MIETLDPLYENQLLRGKLSESESEIFYLKFQIDQLKRKICGTSKRA